VAAMRRSRFSLDEEATEFTEYGFLATIDD
jgi:hypothetical protein